jgi:hypothetical protein
LESTASRVNHCPLCARSRHSKGDPSAFYSRIGEDSYRFIGAIVATSTSPTRPIRWSRMAPQLSMDSGAAGSARGSLALVSPNSSIPKLYSSVIPSGSRKYRKTLPDVGCFPGPWTIGAPCASTCHFSTLRSLHSTAAQPSCTAQPVASPVCARFSDDASRLAV